MADDLPIPHLGLGDALVMESEEKTELDKVLELLLDPANIAHNTELSGKEITAFSVMKTLSANYPLPLLTGFLAENLVMRVSKGRSGRKEWVKIISRQLQRGDMETDMGRRGLGGLMRPRSFNRR